MSSDMGGRGKCRIWRAWNGWSGIGVSRVAIFLMERLLSQVYFLDTLYSLYEAAVIIGALSLFLRYRWSYCWLDLVLVSFVSHVGGILEGL
jgi:hypothetical protein